MDDEKVDLSALELGRDPQRYDRMVRTVAARGVEALRWRNTLPGQLSSWSRPVLAIAAGMMLAGGFALSAPKQAPRPASFEQSLLSWSMSDHVPSGVEVMSSLGGSDGR